MPHGGFQEKKKLILFGADFLFVVVVATLCISATLKRDQAEQRYPGKKKRRLFI